MSHASRAPNENAAPGGRESDDSWVHRDAKARVAADRLSSRVRGASACSGIFTASAPAFPPAAGRRRTRSTSRQLRPDEDASSGDVRPPRRRAHSPHCAPLAPARVCPDPHWTRAPAQPASAAAGHAMQNASAAGSQRPSAQPCRAVLRLRRSLLRACDGCAPPAAWRGRARSDRPPNRGTSAFRTSREWPTRRASHSRW
jgi:hypothetical protein